MSTVVVGWIAAVGLVAWAVLATDPLNPLDASATAAVTLALNSFKMCPDHLDVPSTYDDLIIYQEPDLMYTLFVDGTLNIKEEIPDGAKVIVDLRRCNDERDVSCEKYLIHEVQDICSYLPRKDLTMSNFLERIDGLEPKCPIPPGSYKMNEAPVDLSEYRNTSEYIGHWQVEMSFAREDKRYGCILIDFTLSLFNNAG